VSGDGVGIATAAVVESRRAAREDSAAAAADAAAAASFNASALVWSSSGGSSYGGGGVGSYECLTWVIRDVMLDDGNLRHLVPVSSMAYQLRASSISRPEPLLPPQKECADMMSSSWQLELSSKATNLRN
jgi:hypothetical protein